MNILQKYEKYIYLIILIGVIIYFPIFFNGFVWDDYTFILQNLQVHQINIPALFGPSIFNSGPFYRPIPAVYFAIIYSLSGNHAFLYHFLQLTLHLVDTILLFIYLDLFFTDGIAFFLALIFLVHPINVESVAYIGSTQSELYFLPGMIALLLAAKQSLTRSKFLWISGLLLLATLTKETGALFFLLILAYRYLFKLGNLKKFLLLGIFIIVIYGVLRMFVGGVVFQEASYIPIAALSLPQRLLNIPSIIFYYIKTFVFPSTLTIWQSWVSTKLTFQSFFYPLGICLLVAACILYFAYSLAKKQHKSLQTAQKQKNTRNSVHEKRGNLNEFLFFVFWFVIGISLLLQIVPLDMTVADRWFYFPIVGVLGMIGVVLQFYLPIIKQHYKIYFYGAIVILIVLSLRTFVRTFDFHNYMTLIKHDMKQNKDNPMMLDALAHLYAYNNQWDEALRYETQAVSIYPTVTNLSDLGYIYEEKMQYPEAIQVYTQAIELDKTLPAHNLTTSHGLTSVYASKLQSSIEGLAEIYLKQGRYDDVVNLVNEEGLPRFPTDYNLYYSLGLAEIYLNHYNEALNAINKAYNLSHDEKTLVLLNRLKAYPYKNTQEPTKNNASH